MTRSVEPLSSSNSIRKCEKKKSYRELPFKLIKLKNNKNSYVSRLDFPVNKKRILKQKKKLLQAEENTNDPPPIHQFWLQPVSTKKSGRAKKTPFQKNAHLLQNTEETRKKSRKNSSDTLKMAGNLAIFSSNHNLAKHQKSTEIGLKPLYRAVKKSSPQKDKITAGSATNRPFTLTSISGLKEKENLRILKSQKKMQQRNQILLTKLTKKDAESNKIKDTAEERNNFLNFVKNLQTRNVSVKLDVADLLSLGLMTCGRELAGSLWKNPDEAVWLDGELEEDDGIDRLIHEESEVGETKFRERTRKFASLNPYQEERKRPGHPPPELRYEDAGSNDLISGLKKDAVAIEPRCPGSSKNDLTSKQLFFINRTNVAATKKIVTSTQNVNLYKVLPIISDEKEVRTYHNSDKEEVGTYQSSDEEEVGTYQGSDEEEVGTYQGSDEEEIGTYQDSDEEKVETYQDSDEEEVDIYYDSDKGELWTYRNSRISSPESNGVQIRKMKQARTKTSHDWNNCSRTRARFDPSLPPQAHTRYGLKDFNPRSIKSLNLIDAEVHEGDKKGEWQIFIIFASSLSVCFVFFILFKKLFHKLLYKFFNQLQLFAFWFF